ncbi:MAG: 1-acyl-sn-glycerol-3-phosphate acyltransferase, partial [bacterium]
MADEQSKDNFGNDQVSPSSSTNTETGKTMNSQALVKSENKSTVGASMKTKVGLGFGLALGITAISSYVIFRLMNRVKIEGLENIPTEHENVLYCLNHNSMLDNFAFETTVYLPKIFFQPEYLPINLADRKNFFGDPASRKLKDK